MPRVSNAAAAVATPKGTGTSKQTKTTLQKAGSPPVKANAVPLVGKNSLLAVEEGNAAHGAGDKHPRDRRARPVFSALGRAAQGFEDLDSDDGTFVDTGSSDVAHTDELEDDTVTPTKRSTTKSRTPKVVSTERRKSQRLAKRAASFAADNDEDEYTPDSPLSDARDASSLFPASCGDEADVPMDAVEPRSMAARRASTILSSRTPSATPPVRRRARRQSSVAIKREPADDSFVLQPGGLPLSPTVAVFRPVPARDGTTPGVFDRMLLYAGALLMLPYGIYALSSVVLETSALGADVVEIALDGYEWAQLTSAQAEMRMRPLHADIDGQLVPLTQEIYHILLILARLVVVQMHNLAVAALCLFALWFYRWTRRQ